MFQIRNNQTEARFSDMGGEGGGDGVFKLAGTTC